MAKSKKKETNIEKLKEEVFDFLMGMQIESGMGPYMTVYTTGQRVADGNKFLPKSFREAAIEFGKAFDVLEAERQKLMVEYDISEEEIEY